MYYDFSINQQQSLVSSYITSVSKRLIDPFVSSLAIETQY